MARLVLTVFFAIFLTLAWSQSQQISLGVFSGITAPYTWDEGINADSRYQARYEVKFAPLGVAYGIDYEGFGFVLTPSLIRVGQNFHILNTVGGQEGIRKIDMEYLQVPFAMKLHVIDLSFFKVSLVGGVGVGYLLKGSETITHNYAKYRFPPEVYPILPPDYTIEYDGVVAPKIGNLETVTTANFNKFQIFGMAGFRSDWDVSDSWRVSFDLRANYGFNETRNSSYISSMAANQTLYDMNGKRREMFAYLNIGIARYIEVDKEKEAKTKSQKRFVPKKAAKVIPSKKKRRPMYK